MALAKSTQRQRSADSFSLNRRSFPTRPERTAKASYRSDNKEKVARLKVTRSFGEYWRVLVDDTHRWFAVTHDRSLSEANPDILSFDDLTECRLDILTCPKGRRGNCYEKYDKKRVTALVSALIMIFALGACGGKDTGDKDAAALYIKIKVESDEQLPLVEAILSTLRVNK